MRQQNQELCVYSRKKPKLNTHPEQHCQSNLKNVVIFEYLGVSVRFAKQIP